MIMRIDRIRLLIAIAFIAGCTTYGAAQFEQRFGQASPRERVVESLPVGAVDYWSDVKPVLEQRCVVCHGCYDAPCQLKMSSIEGIERGAIAEQVYQASRLKAAPMTRLGEDADSVAEWREMGFSPVLNEYGDSMAANHEAGVMYRILGLKENNPLPDVKQLPDNFDLSLNRKQFCARPETFDKFAKDHPLWGMPYALPGLSREEQGALIRWIEQGAEYTARAPINLAFQSEIDGWERFLNGDSLKQQLMSRYIFEHLVFGHLYFPDVDETTFFQMVRSATPPGEPIEIIATRRPYNDPTVARVYYRIRHYTNSIVVKTHMPYRLDAARMQRWRSLFLDPAYDVGALPSYEEKAASNPFITFRDLPVNARYRFMLDESQFTIGSFIKGPVCRGQVAVDVIDDHFWVFFGNPDNKRVQAGAEAAAEYSESLDAPAGDVDSFRPIKHWRKYAAQTRDGLVAKDQILLEYFSAQQAVTLDLIWDGNGNNQNAALTVFRNFDSAVVEKGMLGQPPKTAWLIGYPVLETIHYLLVAGYDVYGNLSHQLLTRMYMDFLRMEGETNFLYLLPEPARSRERAFWYRGAEKEVTDYMTLPRFGDAVAPSIDYKTDDPKAELFAKLRQMLEPVYAHRHEFGSITDSRIRNELMRLNRVIGAPATLMPETAFLRIEGQSGDEYVTLIRNTAHLNMTAIFKEQKNLVPEEDTLSVIPGFVGSYPNAFYAVSENDLARFVDVIANLTTEEDYASFLDDYGIRRTKADFWRYSDLFHLAHRQADPLNYGLWDYNRLENR